MKAAVLCLGRGTQPHAQQIIALRHRLAGRSPCAITRPSIRERRRRQQQQQQQRGNSALPSLLPTTFKRSPAARAAIFTGTYATLAGLALALAPRAAFGLLFNASEVPKGWIRVGGILFALIGVQYLGTGLGDTTSTPASEEPVVPAPEAGAVMGGSATSFYRATVWSRLLLAAGFSAIVGIGEAPTSLLILAALNVLGALSMAWALKRTGE